MKLCFDIKVRLINTIENYRPGDSAREREREDVQPPLKRRLNTNTYLTSRLFDNFSEERFEITKNI